MIWLLGLLIIAYLVRHWYICPGRILKSRRFQTKKPIIIFDLHEVILRKDLIGMSKHMIKHAYRLDLFLLCLKPSFIYDVLKLLQKSRVPEEFVITLSSKYKKLEPFIEIIIAIMNEQKIIQPTVQLMQRLKAHGYDLYLFSNIGEKTFIELEKKLPNLFDLFDGIVITQEQDNWIQKPYPSAFAKFLSRFNLTARDCIFIDNSHSNVKTALDEGMYPILFKSPAQLFHELNQLNIL